MYLLLLRTHAWFAMNHVHYGQASRHESSSISLLNESICVIQRCLKTSWGGPLWCNTLLRQSVT